MAFTLPIPVLTPHELRLMQAGLESNPFGTKIWEILNTYATMGATRNITADSNGVAVMGEAERIASIDTSAGDIILFVPPVSTGRLTVHIKPGGAGKVQATPCVAGEGVNGLDGATYLLDPAEGLSAEFLGDTDAGVWWLVS